MRGEIGPKMATDDERRRVAAALRTCILGRGFRDRNDAMATLLESVSMAVGLAPAHDPTMQDLCDRLADLIEPTCDREALLALAEEMGHPIKQAVWNQTAGVRREHIMAEYARHIREACGVVA